MRSIGLPRDSYAHPAAPPVFHRTSDADAGRANRIPWRLTPREAEVAALIARGWSSREIAGSLAISLHTVRRHTERIFDKTGVRSRTRLIVLIGGREGASAPALLLAAG